MSGKRYVSVICEYNPFHFGHLYQLEALKSAFDGVVCILSGDIVQRGSIAVADKYLRAEAALRSGANLVLELPIPWCCSSARDFAAAGVFIANAIGSHSLAFGTEDGIDLIAEIQKHISRTDFSHRAKKLAEEKGNLSYPAALSELMGGELGDAAREALAKPNNILALEYLSAMDGKSIQPFAVKRNLELSSSSELRALKEGERILRGLPPQSRAVFEKALHNGFPRDEKKLDSFFIGTLRRMEHSGIVPQNIYSAPDDLIKKLLAESVKAASAEELVAACRDKIYTSARIRRAVIALVFGITVDKVRAMPPFTCVLAADPIGREILKSAKKNCPVDIITKPVKALSAKEETKEAFLFAKGIEDVISLSAPVPEPTDKGRTPTIL